MDIRILPSNIANMIAAGEVVQRPASVVKELVENAVDAGAGQITVVIQDAGRTLIQVIDNGCGMSPDQAVLCFERHATSKLHDAEDLQNILTFGFRGEALASIAAVAEVTLKTRREEDEVGCQVDFADSQHLATQEVAVPRGANFSVCHFLLQCRKVKSESEVTQSCPTLSDPMDCSPPGSSTHGIFQARVLEWGAIAVCHNFSSEEQASFNFQAVVSICHDFGAQEKSLSLFPLFPHLFVVT